jgi:hypothetical protein
MHSSIYKANLYSIVKLNVIVPFAPALSCVDSSNPYFRLYLSLDMVPSALEKVSTVRRVMAYLL